MKIEDKIKYWIILIYLFWLVYVSVKGIYEKVLITPSLIAESGIGGVVVSPVILIFAGIDLIILLLSIWGIKKFWKKLKG